MGMQSVVSTGSLGSQQHTVEGRASRRAHSKGKVTLRATLVCGQEMAAGGAWMPGVGLVRGVSPVQGMRTRGGGGGGQSNTTRSVSALPPPPGGAGICGLTLLSLVPLERTS